MAEKTKKSSKDDNLFALIAYALLGFGFIMYFIKKESAFVRFHALQATFYNIGFGIVFIGLTILTPLLSAIPGVGWIVGLVLGLFIMLLGAVWFFYGLFIAYKAYTGEKYKVPFVGNLAADHA